MLKNKLAITLLFFCLLCNSQVVINNNVYIDKKAFVKLDKMKRLKSIYLLSNNKKISNTVLWKKSKNIIFDNYSTINYSTTTKMNIVDLKVIQNYNVIYKRAILVNKNPKKYSKFWKGWFKGFYKYTYKDINNIVY